MDLTDEQWVALKPFLPKTTQACGRTQQGVAGREGSAGSAQYLIARQRGSRTSGR
jgi:hypothetical protein